MTSLARQHRTNPLTKAPALESNGLAAAKSAAGFNSPQLQGGTTSASPRRFFRVWHMAPSLWRDHAGALRGCRFASCSRSVDPYGPASTRSTARETELTFIQEAAMCIARPPTLQALDRAQRIVQCWKALTRVLGCCPGHVKPKEDAFILAEFLSTEHSKSLELAHDWMRYWKNEGETTRALLGMNGQPDFEPEGKP